MELMVRKTGFQTFRRFATPAAAQTGGFRLGRKEAVVVSDPELHPQELQT